MKAVWSHIREDWILLYIDLIERCLDVKLNNPVILPATLSRDSNRLLCRFTRPVAMDEFAIQKGHRYATVIVEPSSKRVL